MYGWKDVVDGWMERCSGWMGGEMLWMDGWREVEMEAKVER